MLHTEKSKNGFSRTVIALLLATLGVITPIIWDWWSSKSELTITKEQRTNLIEKKTVVEGLSITYLGHEIESLSKITFTLENTGRSPIEAADLISPPTLTITEGGLLSATIESMTPDNISGQLNQQNNRVSISFPLLNPGDKIKISLLISGQKFAYEVESRIKNISTIKTLDEQNQIKIRSTFGLSTYIVGFFLIIFIALFFVLLNQAPKRKRAHNSIKKGLTPFSSGDHSNTAISYIETELNFLANDKMDTLKKIALSNGNTLSAENTKELTTTINSYVTSTNPGAGAIIMLLPCIAGIYYIYSNIFI